MSSSEILKTLALSPAGRVTRAQAFVNANAQRWREGSSVLISGWRRQRERQPDLQLTAETQQKKRGTITVEEWALSLQEVFSYTAEVRAHVPLVQLISKRGRKGSNSPPPPRIPLTHWWTDGGVLTTQREGTLWSHISHTRAAWRKKRALRARGPRPLSSRKVEQWRRARTAPNVRFSCWKMRNECQKQAYVEFSWLICTAAMIRLHFEAWAKHGRRRWWGGVGGLGGAWLADKENCKEMWGRRFSIHPGRRPRKGWGQEGQGGDREPLSISPRTHLEARARALTHTHTLMLTPDRHKSIWLNASAAATQVLNAAHRGFILCRRYCHRAQTHTSSSWLFPPASHRELMNEHIKSLPSFALSSFSLYDSLGCSFCLIHAVKNHY